MARSRSRNRYTPERGSASKPLHEVDWKNDDDVVAFVQGLEDTRSQRKGSLEKEWLLNISYYLGKQNVRWNDGTGALYERNVPSWRARLVCDKILPFVRKAIARWVRNDPTWTAVPATNEQEDQQVARVANQVLEGYWRHCDMSFVLIDALTWMGTTGNGFLKALWDVQKGPPISVGADDLEGGGEQDKGLLERAKQKFEEVLGRKPEKDETKELHLGDLEIEAVSPFEIDVPVGTTSVRNALWLKHSKIRDPDYIRQRYGKDVDVDSDEGLAGYYQRRIESMTSTGSGSTSDMDEGVMVHELWVRPIKGWPKGIRVVVGGGKVLEEPKANPYEHGLIPFVQLKEVHVSGRFWADSVVTHLRPLQDDYNKARSQVKENRDAMSKPKWLVHRMARIAGNAITSEPGEIIIWEGTIEPKPVVPPPIPHYVTQTMELDQADMQDIAFSHDVSMGKNPPGARSGDMIQSLKEGDEQDLTPTGQMIDRAIEHLGSLVLQTLHQYVSEDRLVKIVGKNNALDVVSFRGTDLVGKSSMPNVSYFDVRVQSYSKLPQSRTATLGLIDKMVERTVLNPQADRDTILGAIGMGDTKGFVDETAADRSRQIWENNLLAGGQNIQPERYENHAVHMKVINEYRKGAEFITMEPKVKMLFEQHYMTHELMEVAEVARKQALLQQAMVQQQLMVSGAVDQPPGSEQTLPGQEQALQPTGEPQPG